MFGSQGYRVLIISSFVMYLLVVPVLGYVIHLLTWFIGSFVCLFVVDDDDDDDFDNGHISLYFIYGVDYRYVQKVKDIVSLLVTCFNLLEGIGPQ